MDLTLERSHRALAGILSVLMDASGLILFHTLEHAYPVFDGDPEPKLPAGIYTCQRGIHALHDGVPFSAFEILDVPGHTGILFHVGNFNSDSDGCVLLGEDVIMAPNTMVTQSRVAFARFMDLHKNVESFILTVRG